MRIYCKRAHFCASERNAGSYLVLFSLGLNISGHFCKAWDQKQCLHIIIIFHINAPSDSRPKLRGFHYRGQFLFLACRTHTMRPTSNGNRNIRLLKGKKWGKGDTKAWLYTEEHSSVFSRGRDTSVTRDLFWIFMLGEVRSGSYRLSKGSWWY